MAGEFDPDAYLAETKDTGFDPDAYLSSMEPPSELGSALRGAIQGASFGLRDEGAGALASPSGALKEIANKFGADFSDEDLDAYRKERDLSRALDKKAEELNPGSYMGGELGGSLATTLIPGLGALSGARGASLGVRAAQAAGAGALSGVGLSDAETGKTLAQDAAIGGALGGAFQGIGEKVVEPLIGKAVPYLKRGAESLSDSASGLYNSAIKKAGKIVAEVPEEDTAAYLAKRARYQNPRSREQLKDMLDQTLELKQQGVKGLDDKLQQLKYQYDQAVSSHQMSLADEAMKAKESMDLAKGNLDSTSRELRAGLKNPEDPRSAVDDIAGAMAQMKQKVSGLSGEAFDTLEQTPITLGGKEIIPNGSPVFPKSWVEDALRSGQKTLEIEGKAPFSGDAAQGYRKLQGELEALAEYPDTLKLSSVKKIIQGLDNEITTAKALGEFNTPDTVAKVAARRALDAQLKSLSPKYKEVMQGLAEKTDLLGQASQRFGTPEKIQARLRSLHKNSSYGDKELLERLAKETGLDLTSSVSPIVRSFQTAENPALLDAAISGLPESKAYSEASERFNSLPTTRSEQTALARASADSQYGTEIANAESAYQAASNELKGLGLSERRSENVIKSFLRGNPSIEDKRAIERLAPELLDELEKAKVANSFDKTYTNGSRRTVMGEVLGRAIGAGIGGLAGYGTADGAGGLVGAAAGATGGFGADKYAGQIFRKFLDGKLAVDALTPQVTKQLGKFGKVLSDASARGGKSLAATHFVLQQTNPEYQGVVSQLQGDGSDGDNEE